MARFQRTLAEGDPFNGSPVSGLPGPSLRVLLLGGSIDPLSVIQECPVFSPMPLGWGHEFQGTMPMVLVVLPGEGLHPLPGLLQLVEGLGHRIVRPICKRLKSASEKALSLLTEGLPKEGRIPSFWSVPIIVAPFIGDPLSE